MNQSLGKKQQSFHPNLVHSFVWGALKLSFRKAPLGLQPGPLQAVRAKARHQGLRNKCVSKKETNISLGTPLHFASLGYIRTHLAVLSIFPPYPCNSVDSPKRENRSQWQNGPDKSIMGSGAAPINTERQDLCCLML